MMYQYQIGDLFVPEYTKLHGFAYLTGYRQYTFMPMGYILTWIYKSGVIQTAIYDELSIKDMLAAGYRLYRAKK